MYGSDQPGHNPMMGVGPNEKILYSIDHQQKYDVNWRKYIWLAPIVIMILGLAMYGLRKII